MKAGFWVDLQAVKLGDGTSTWIQMMPLGKWSHPIYGEISFTPERLTRFADNFNKNVRGTEIDIDFSHKGDLAKGDKAAGWLRQVEVKGSDGLWGLVEWTKEAAAEIKDGQWKYFSPEFADEWVHPTTGEKHQDVIFGGGITNRPHMKDILPINMTEVFGHQQPTPTGGQMEELLKKLGELLGLKEGEVTEEAILAAGKTLVEKANTPPPKADPPAPKTDPEDDELKKLGETNPAIAKLLADRAEDRLAIKALQATSRMSEVRLRVKTLAETGAEKERAIGKAQQDQLEEILLGSAPDVADKVFKFVEDLFKTGFVELGELGTRRTTDSKDSIKKFTEAVAAKQKANEKLSYSDAASQVSQENPQLWTDYNEALFESVGGEG